MRYFLINILHVNDGKLTRRDMTQAPSRGDWIKFNKQTFIVKNVIWNYDDARTVDVIVEELED